MLDGETMASGPRTCVLPQLTAMRDTQGLGQAVRNTPKSKRQIHLW